MTSTGLGAPAAASARIDEPAPHVPHDEHAVAAWLSAIPAAGLVALAAWLLGPPLGDLTSPAGGYTFTPEFAKVVRPEPTEHARYLIALTLPLAISLAVCFSPRWLSRIPPRTAREGAVAVQALLAAIVAACYGAQDRLTFGAVYTQGHGTIQMSYFTPATLLAAAGLAGVTIAVLRQARTQGVARALLRDSRPKRLAALSVAVLMTALWLSHAVETDRTLANAPFDMRFNFAFTLNETFALLNGLTPLVDFTAQYGSLWPFVVALPMLALGKTVLVFSIAMCTVSGFALLSIYSVLRRIVRSSLGALLLYLPFLATSVFWVLGERTNHSTVATYYAIFPLRYAGPYFLAFLTARLIEHGMRPSAAYPLFLVGGLTILNNLEFGVPALGASIVALAWAATGTARPSLHLSRFALAAGAGLMTAPVLVCLLTLARAGSLPELDRLTDYARLFAVAGFAMMPVPGLLGLHLVIYLTHVTAVVVGTVRAVQGARDRLLTGMLVWAGTFGLGSGTYYIGRSHPLPLKFLFSAWALSLALLTIVVVRGLLHRRPSIAAALVLVGFGVAACSLAQMPTPWGEARRFDSPYVATTESDNSPHPLAPPTDPATQRFVSTIADGPKRFVYARGAPIAIMLRTGHRIADAYGVRNVSPYSGMESTPTVERVEAVLDALEHAGGNTLILPNPVDGGIFPALERRGFRLVTHHGLDRYDPSVPHGDAVMPLWSYGYVIKWVDTRHLHPAWLR
jgi:hypothetical protein